MEDGKAIAATSRAGIECGRCTTATGLLGRGGMGVVLKVTHLHLGEELALKILSPEAAATPDVTARFLREAQSAVRLRGEHVA